MEKNNGVEEIDLIELLSICWRKLYAFIQGIVGILVWCVRLIYKKRLYFVAATLISAAIAAYIARPSNRSYRMEAEMRINVMDAYFFHDLVNTLDLFCKNKDHNSLCYNLQMDCDDCERIQKAQSFFYIDEMKDNRPDRICYGEYKADSTSQVMEDRLLVRLVIKDSTDINKFKDGLLHYFRNNSIAYKTNNERIEQLEGKIAMLKNETELLDSLRRNEYFKKTNPDLRLSGSLFLTEKEKQLYHTQLLDLESRLNEAKYQKAINADPVNFVSDFYLVKVENGLMKTFIYLFIGVNVLCFLIMAYLAKRKKIISFLEAEED